ncbi:hypothetical protein CAP31_12370 [Sulfuriferula sp. AH1]|nr:hypothetical protein CAP31_12370 [Sulfuriferula sp. AH1]
MTLSLLAYNTGASAGNVNVTGLFKDRAMVVIDSGKPRVMAVGDSTQGVRLLRADSQSAMFEIDGKRRVLTMGESYTGSGGSAKPVATLNADGRGQFYSVGSINGSSVNFVVDTGATLVTISTQEADRLGVNYRKGQRGAIYTANGSIGAYHVIFNNIRIGGISLNMVPGTVVEGNGLPIALLGMSFLNQTDIQRNGTTMTLTQRY